ncbi:DUF3703 domain-containing protein [Halobacteriovorax sp. HLS]|uniref:DUF3703 domain-containing protein n=1 Tax=Halobacteriovorax sp. HLS TaxID=2234000 RepID=UPI000FDCAA59|nr:DUF3703 domain-containing protein [Halobacteriovorax sp. HLS]
MNAKLKKNFELKLGSAKRLIRLRKFEEAFTFLEDAHVLGQSYIFPHTITHIYMLKIGFLKKDKKEILGQLFRIPMGILGSMVGILPVGNTGGSNVSAFKKMKIRDDLEKMLE